ncbi:hypothetical protein MCOR25_000821 [Pyricularia grisea]|uniref:Yeast cell wall synthesis Kre9/Knh1-like N-terminal domain-containing protein n=1 Tax=Pyricularia grisea TaxID=148305 RepID=A0A6P8AR55_PYRGI|nr:uncharacterized protein PgNI_11942 [Pyricularia grisea]KAI6382232.1 hypothetical protein MCOR25_000821 [Pyricularia grisea]TLD04526.1 hypothetical protein PgNI_11942 [Pyricularia grisea]
MVSSLALLALASGALALKVTSPNSNTVWSSNEKHTITWESVSTDQTSFNIYLSNKVTYPPSDILIASDVQASAGSYEVASGKLPAGNSYTIDFTNGTKTEQIYAQSNQFNVTGGSSSSSSSSSSSTSTTATGSSTGADSTATASTTSTTSSGSSSSATSTAKTSGASDASSTATGSSASATASKAANSANGKMVVSWMGAAALAALAL